MTDSLRGKGTAFPRRPFPVSGSIVGRLIRDTSRTQLLPPTGSILLTLKHGLHAANGEVQDPNFRNIGNLDLTDKRSHRRVRVGPDGVLSDYIPFYFTPFSVMMHNIHTGYNVRQVPNEEIVLLVSSLHRVTELGIPFVFTCERIDGFGSPLGMELLATVDWLIQRKHAEPTLPGIRSALRQWPAGEPATARKLRLFNDRLLQLALDRLQGDAVSPQLIP